MTVFIASLFLPYTINFDVSPSRPTSPPEAARPPTAHSEKRVSLFTGPAQILPLKKLVQTPGATTDHELIFTPHVDKPFNLHLPLNGRHRAPSATSLPVTTPGARDPRSISRTDLQSPTWGKALSWNQPKSRAKSPPPSSILRHNIALDAEADGLSRSATWKTQYKHKAREKARTVSHERRFTESNYTIEKARLGNGGLFNAIDAVSESGLLGEKTWVGTLGMPTNALDDHLKEVISEHLEDDYESLSVMVDDSDFDGHYEHYCKIILWPHFHYQIPDHPKSKAYEDRSWSFYVKVNQAFADRIVANYKKGDIIWVHDYHLILVPGMLRKKLPEAQIGFFMHTAFPSSEVFRCIPTRADLLEGLLGANMVGFQTDEYGHHFLQTCSRILNVEANKHGIVLEDGRFVHVAALPIGVDPKGLDELRSLPDVAEWIQTISEKYAGKRIIVARDKLDNIRGVKQKVIAYEQFLTRYPEYKDQVVLIQIATSTTENDGLSAKVADIVTRVNSNHSTLAHQPLVFLRQDIDHSQYLALLTVAECLMITSLREGMNLTCHEFIYCQDGKYSENKCGPLILSEFTGSASMLGSQPLLINPWDTKQCANAIKKALDMSADDRKCRWHNMYSVVMRHNATTWYETYMEHLKHAWEEHSGRDTTSVPRLSYPALKLQYEAAGRRLLLLDYEGTLASWGSPADIISQTPKKLTDTLNDLIDDSKNTVYVMSARMPEELEQLFNLVPNLGLVAENGAFIREPYADDWIELADMEHVKSWKKGVRSILQYYVERIENSRINDRHSGVIFDYSETEDKAAAFKQAGECANHINDACQEQHIHAVPIENGIVISGSNENKGAAAKMIGENLEKLRDEKGIPMPEFLLVIGDSREDEFVFSWAQNLEKKGVIRDVITVTLGTRSTGASHTLTQGVTGWSSVCCSPDDLLMKYRSLVHA